MSVCSYVWHDVTQQDRASYTTHISFGIEMFHTFCFFHVCLFLCVTRCRTPRPSLLYYAYFTLCHSVSHVFFESVSFHMCDTTRPSLFLLRMYHALCHSFAESWVIEKNFSKVGLIQKIESRADFLRNFSKVGFTQQIESRADFWEILGGKRDSRAESRASENTVGVLPRTTSAERWDMFVKRDLFVSKETCTC